MAEQARLSSQPSGIIAVDRGHSRYPAAAITLLGDAAPKRIFALGNLETLSAPLLALFCSSKCPGNLILQTYDLACALREAGVTVIAGFHTPMERECLRLLLRGKQPVMICPARGIHKRIPRDWKKPLADGRLLILSPFEEKHRRMTSGLSAIRNRFVAALAGRIFIAYAAPGSKTEALAREIIAWGKPVLTLDSPENANLIALGSEPVPGGGWGQVEERSP